MKHKAIIWEGPAKKKQVWVLPNESFPTQLRRTKNFFLKKMFVTFYLYVASRWLLLLCYFLRGVPAAKPDMSVILSDFTR